MALEARTWSTAVLQAVAVLGGVLLALAADAAWDYRNDRAQELEYLLAFQIDFEENRTRIQDALSFHDDSERSLRRLLTVIDSAGQSEVSEDSVRLWLQPMYVLLPYEPILATLDDLVQSGSLNLIRDDSLRRGLAEFRRSLEAHELTEQYAQDYWKSEMVAVFRDDMAVRYLPGFERELGPSAFPTDLAELFRSRRFENRVALRWALGDDLQITAQAVSRTVDLILGRLELILSDQ